MRIPLSPRTGLEHRRRLTGVSRAWFSGWGSDQGKCWKPPKHRSGDVSRGSTWPETGGGLADSAGDLFHSIGETSRLTGVSRGMLRVWERERLINPKRTPGGHRLYSSNDVLRLRQIARLRRVDRLN